MYAGTKGPVPLSLSIGSNTGIEFAAYRPLHVVGDLDLIALPLACLPLLIRNTYLRPRVAKISLHNIDCDRITQAATSLGTTFRFPALRRLQLLRVDVPTVKVLATLLRHHLHILESFSAQAIRIRDTTTMKPDWTALISDLHRRFNGNGNRNHDDGQPRLRELYITTPRPLYNLSLIRLGYWEKEEESATYASPSPLARPRRFRRPIGGSWWYPTGRSAQCYCASPASLRAEGGVAAMRDGLEVYLRCLDRGGLEPWSVWDTVANVRTALSSMKRFEWVRKLLK